MLPFGYARIEEMLLNGIGVWFFRCVLPINTGVVLGIKFATLDCGLKEIIRFIEGLNC